MFQEPFLSMMGKLLKLREVVSGYLWEQVGSCEWAVLCTEVLKAVSKLIACPFRSNTKKREVQSPVPCPTYPRSSKTDRCTFLFKSLGQVVGFEWKLEGGGVFLFHGERAQMPSDEAVGGGGLGMPEPG